MPRPIKLARGRTGRQLPGTMNKTEARYAAELDRQQAAGEIIWWRYEGITFILSYGGNGKSGQRYTPDFVVEYPDGLLECREVKGFIDQMNINKVKVAAELYPFRFVLVRARTKAQGGGWELREL